MRLILSQFTYGGNRERPTLIVIHASGHGIDDLFLRKV